MTISGTNPSKVIRVREKTWLRLFWLKNPGESFDAVINRHLDTVKEAKLRISEEK